MRSSSTKTAFGVVQNISGQSKQIANIIFLQSSNVKSAHISIYYLKFNNSLRILSNSNYCALLNIYLCGRRHFLILNISSSGLLIYQSPVNEQDQSQSISNYNQIACQGLYCNCPIELIKVSEAGRKSCDLECSHPIWSVQYIFRVKILFKQKSERI
ncbi:Hypothetical_protein [Hexamita inflata]|uniref:Hypothetical_protein n=1 Tax=Hexamita inflata TaxID=28002 RepID=A0AA86TT67_9EUKA|nr:Hypothetical protein HINF_LOCUS15704 [Hexamita inflata]